MKTTRSKLIAAVEQVNNAKFDDNDKTQQAMLFLAAAAHEGTTNYTKISRASGIPLAACQKFSWTARAKHGLAKQPIFVGRKIRCNWNDPNEGGLAFILNAQPPR